MEIIPARVSATTKQVGAIRVRWAWVEPSVWTDRMLTALEQGVKGGVWFSLIDKVYAPANLLASHAKVAANRGAAGVDHVTVEDFTKRLSCNVEKLAAQLKDGEFRPQSVRRVNIPKPGTKETRPLGIPTVRDRVVQGALRHVLEPIFERQFAEHSYGFRPGRGCKDALSRVDKLLKEGCRYVVDVDLKSYFDTIPHDKLLDAVRQHVADSQVLALIEAFLKADIMDGVRQWTPESGAPQGAVLSPLLSNLYLNALDHQMVGSGYEMTRYADDLVIQCRSREDAERALELVRAWTVQAGLTLHPTKTKIVDAEIDGFEFLGYRFIKHRRFPRRKSLAKFKDAIRAKTQRTNGRSLTMIIADVNRSLRGWFEYFKTQLPHDLSHNRRLGTHAFAEHSSQTSRRQRSRSRKGSPPLAERLLYQARAVKLDNRPCLGQSILSKVKLSTGEPDAGDPPVRFGGREPKPIAFPTPIFPLPSPSWPAAKVRSSSGKSKTPYSTSSKLPYQRCSSSAAVAEWPRWLHRNTGMGVPTRRNTRERRGGTTPTDSQGGPLATHTFPRVREASRWPYALGGCRPVPTGRRPRAATGKARRSPPACPLPALVFRLVFAVGGNYLCRLHRCVSLEGCPAPAGRK